jgi:hypothetical protein
MNLVDLNMIQERLKEKPKPIEIGPNGMSIDLLRAVYRDASLALAVRMRELVSEI